MARTAGGGETTAHLFRLGQPQLAEDSQGLLEAGPGGDGLAGPELDVAQRGQDSRLVGAAAQAAEQRHGPLQARGGRAGLAEQLIGVSEALPRAG